VANHPIAVGHNRMGVPKNGQLRASTLTPSGWDCRPGRQRDHRTFRPGRPGC
jgi:hypothetical protein